MKNFIRVFLFFFCFFAFQLNLVGCFGSSKSNQKTCAMVLNESLNTQDVTTITTEYVFGTIEETLTQREDLKIIDRSKVSAVKKEHVEAMSDWASDSEKVAVIGHQLGAELLCFVSVYNDSYKVEFLHVNTFQKRTFTGNYSKELFSSRVKVKSLKELKKLKLNDLIDSVTNSK